MKETQIFNFGDEKVRTLVINYEPYFVGKDVADILGYSNTAKAIRDHVDEEDKTQNDSFTVNGTAPILINESGLYSLVLKSKLPSAKQFKRWVTKEVLPTIRKHGAYLTDQKIEEALLNPDVLINLATQLKQERTGRLVAEQKVAELQPKANYYDTILANKSITPISFIAKNYGMSAVQMNRLLHDYGIQYRQGKAWLLYAKYQKEGYTHTEMVPVQGSDNLKPIMKWTQKGHLFIYDFLKKHDILPTIETLFDKAE